MKRAVLIIACVAAVSASRAQEKWTLKQCIDHAVENNIAVRQQALAVESAETNLNTSRNSRLPNLNAGVSQNFSFGRATSDEDNTYMMNTQTSSTSFSLSAGLPVFQGFRINHEIKQGELDLLAAAEGLEKAKQNLELAVAGYFLDVLFRREILNVYDEQLELSQKRLGQTAEMVRTGKVAESQLFDMRSQVAANEVNVITAQNDLLMSLLNLSQALNLEWSPLFDIAAPDIDGAVSQSSALVQPAIVYNTALGIKPHIREAEYRLQGSESRISIAKSARWPSISLGVDFRDGYSYMFGQNNINLSEQIRNKHSEIIGLNMSIPIFNRYSTRNSIRLARIDRAGYALQLENAKLELYKEIQQAYQGAAAAQAKFSASERAVEAAEESFRAMELRFEYGKATVYEYNESQTKLISSRSDLLQAKYDFLFRSKILDFYRGAPIDLR